MLKNTSVVQSVNAIASSFDVVMQKFISTGRTFLAIREELDFASAAIRFSEGPESAQEVELGHIADLGHPELKMTGSGNEGDLIGPFAVGDMHVLLRLDTRITTRLDEALQAQILSELYADWLERQLQLLEVGDSIEPPEYIPAL